MTLAAFLLALAGFAVMAAATARLRPSPRWRMWGKPAGFALLAASCLLRLGTPSWRITLVEWIGELTAAALIVVLIANWRPRLLPWLGGGAVIGALIAYSR